MVWVKESLAVVGCHPPLQHVAIMEATVALVCISTRMLLVIGHTNGMLSYLALIALNQTKMGLFLSL